MPEDQVSIPVEGSTTFVPIRGMVPFQNDCNQSPVNSTKATASLSISFEKEKQSVVRKPGVLCAFGGWSVVDRPQGPFQSLARSIRLHVSDALFPRKQRQRTQEADKGFNGVILPQTTKLPSDIHSSFLPLMSPSHFPTSPLLLFPELEHLSTIAPNSLLPPTTLSLPSISHRLDLEVHYGKLTPTFQRS